MVKTTRGWTWIGRMKLIVPKSCSKVLTQLQNIKVVSVFRNAVTLHFAKYFAATKL